MAVVTSEAETKEELLLDIGIAMFFGGLFAGLPGKYGVNWRNTTHVSGLFTNSNMINSLKVLGRKLTESAIIAAAQYAGDKVGGVDLNRTAEVLLDINEISGVAYDEATGQLIIYGKDHLSLPPMNIDDLAVAARAAALGD